MEKANLSQLATDWSKITIDRWKKNIEKRGIGHSGDLFKSFVSNIIRNSDGDPKRIELSFLFYGRFVDMGVGRGGSVKTQSDEKTLRGRAGAFKSTSRRAKKWYSKTLAAETRSLARLLAKEFAIKGINIIEDQLLSAGNDPIKLAM